MGHTLRVVLGTRVLLSGIAFPGSVPGKFMSAWRLGSLEVVLSDFILDELRRVLPRLHHRHSLTSAEIDDLLDILSIQAEVLEPQAPDEQLLRDVMICPCLAPCWQRFRWAASITSSQRTRICSSSVIATP